MKFFIIVILLNFISKRSTATIKFTVDGKWYEWYVKELKDILRNGFPSMGIPKLDPFQVNSTYSWENPTNKINLNLRGLLSNFSNFYVNNIDIKPDLQSIIDLEFTSISFLGNYQLNGEAMKMIPLDESGNIDIFLGNVIVSVDCKLYGRNRTVQISTFSLKYDFGISKISIAGLFKQYHLSNIIKQFIVDLVPTALNQLKSPLQKMVDQFTLDSGNKWLKEMNPQHIIEEFKFMILSNKFSKLLLNL